MRFHWVAAGAITATLAVALPASAASPRVLTVGTWHHHQGQYTTIQSAVDAAQPGDWILVGPGIYHEQADHRANRGPQPADTAAGVIISTPDITLRGMDRNGVVVDGTLPNSHGACSTAPADQDFGVKGDDGKPLGRNGIVVWKADDVSIENLTACNFLAGAGSSGNEIWWNGGDGSGKIGLGRFYGSYLNATSTFYNGEDTAAQYGLFSSNADGPGRWDHTYASNFNDSDYYIGACAQVCNQIVDDAHAEYSTLGYSGTNSGGSLIVENSEFDNNRDGFDTNSQNNDDAPPPQDGACPNNGTNPVTHTHSCWLFMHNYVHDNNNPDVPGAGVAGASPIGTGMSVAGGRDDTILDNRFENNGAWGITLLPYPDTETPPDVAHCQGGIAGPDNACLFDDWGNEVADNTFEHNGFFGNDTNSDFGEVTTTAAPTNCFHGNTEEGGGQPTSSPSGLQQSKPTCGTTAAPDPNPSMTNQALCATQFEGPTPCVDASYPQQTKVVMHPLPAGLPTMPDPCAGVPNSTWCPAHAAKHHKAKHHHTRHHHAKAHHRRRDPDHDGDHDSAGQH